MNLAETVCVFPSKFPETSLLAGKYHRRLRLITDIRSTDRYSAPESTGILPIPYDPGKSRLIPASPTVIARTMIAVIEPGAGVYPMSAPEPPDTRRRSDPWWGSHFEQSTNFGLARRHRRTTREASASRVGLSPGSPRLVRDPGR